MRTIRILLASIAFISMTSAIVFSQTDKPYKFSGMCGDRAGYMTDYLKKELGLSTDQYNSVYKIFLSHEEQRDQDFEKFSNDRDAFRDAAAKRREKLDSDLSSVLSSSQLEKFRQVFNQAQDNMRNKYGMHRRMRGNQ